MIKTNYHTHTYRCKHAVGDDEAYVLAAIAAGFEVLGFSDHCPWPFEGDYRSGIRMEMDMLDEYVENLSRLREKYKDKIEIKIGLECEYVEPHIDWLTRIKAQKGIDYLIFGNHFPYREEEGHRHFAQQCTTPEVMDLYRETTLAGINSGIFAYVAHPDIFFEAYPSFDEHAERACKEICRAAAIMDTPLEFNISGFARSHDQGTGFPNADFWKTAAECGCSAIIGFDAHSHTSLLRTEEYDRALTILDALNIPRIERIEL